MGADLYIEKIYDENEAKYRPLFYEAVKKRDEANDGVEKDRSQKEVEKYYEKMNEVGYFRDSYNNSSLFWKLGLSWWGCKLISKHGYISVANAKKLKKIVEAAPAIVITDEQAKGWSNTRAEVQEYFDEKRTRFVEFLDTAINAKQKIRASV